MKEKNCVEKRIEKEMKEIFEKMKDINVCEHMVTIKSAMNEENIIQMEILADELLK